MKVALALASARMKGRVRTTVHATDELLPGDHVAFNTGTVYYYQHAVVARVDGTFYTLYYLHIQFYCYYDRLA